MADISKINAVLLANIAEIDDVLAANIAKVNGLVFTSAPAFSGLLDTYTGAAAAYSTRRLYSLYTGAALRVREDGTDTETDIGFDSNGDLDTAAIATHCGSANGYVSKWYDQSQSGGTGSGTDAVQATEVDQPQIYNGTSVITENAKPTLDFAGTGFFTATLAAELSQPNTYSSVAKTESGQIRSTLSDGYSNRNLINYANASGVLQMFAGSAVNGSDQRGSQNHLFALFSGSSSYCYVNGTQDVSGNVGADGLGTQLDIGAGGGTGSPFNELHGNIQEWIVWNSNQDTNRSGIEGNLNAHYQIGNFGTPTSGLLATYSGAAAAYSVRQLANTAALAMRVREDGTDTELDIGFDANGDLDTAAIASHCGANNGYVVTWYDQSGNQNDATQATDASQPQIYNGTAVVTDNGKSALDFDGSNDFFGSIAVASATANTLTWVGNPDAVNDGIRRIFARPNAASNQAQLNQDDYVFQDYETGPTLFSQAKETAVSAVQSLLFSYVTNTNKTARLGYNGGTFNAGTTLTKDLQIIGTAETDAKIGSKRDGADNYWNGKMQELILWTNDQSGSRTNIESDINTYFSIY